MAEIHRGRTLSLEQRKILSKVNIGNRNAAGHIAPNKGIPRLPEVRAKISAKLKGHIGWDKGKKRHLFSEEARRNISLGKRGKPISQNALQSKMESIIRGQNHHFWKGGLSVLPYKRGWTKTFKRAIRERDKNICQLCGKTQIELGKLLDVHHIDYDKHNLDPLMKISLCHPCHMKTNNKNRQFWEAHFTTMMLSKIADIVIVTTPESIAFPQSS